MILALALACAPSILHRVEPPPLPAPAAEAPQAPARVRALTLAARLALLRGDSADAMRLARTGLLHAPDAAALHLVLGEAQLASGAPADARGSFLLATRGGAPIDRQAWEGVARAARSGGDGAGAKSADREALRAARAAGAGPVVVHRLHAPLADDGALDADAVREWSTVPGGTAADLGPRARLRLAIGDAAGAFDDAGRALRMSAAAGEPVREDALDVYVHAGALLARDPLPLLAELAELVRARPADDRLARRLASLARPSAAPTLPEGEAPEGGR